jgi:Rrf2 family protein
MHVTAKADYSVRAALALALAHPEPVKGEQIAADHDLPLNFTERILSELRRAGYVASRRGGDGGYRLAADPERISVADLIRAVEGPMAHVRGIPPDELDYPDAAEPLQRVWVALRANLRAVLESVSLADLAAGSLPDHVEALAADPDAWARRVGPT